MATLFSGDGNSLTSQGANEDDGRPRCRWFAARRGVPAAAAAPEGNGQWFSMALNDTYRATDVRDFPVRCREGTLWVTSPEMPGDTIVAAGEHLSVTSRGTLLIVALAPSSMWIPQGHAAGATAKSLRPLLDAAFMRVVAAFARRRSSCEADALERYLSGSVDHADFEHRLQSWDAHEQRL